MNDIRKYYLQAPEERERQLLNGVDGRRRSSETAEPALPLLVYDFFRSSMVPDSGRRAQTPDGLGSASVLHKSCSRFANSLAQFAATLKFSAEFTFRNVRALNKWPVNAMDRADC